MKAKKFVVNFIIVLIFAAAVFFIGWVQFLVKPNHCAILTSKTSGLYPEAIENGKFVWIWQRLLPTNVLIEQFSLAPKHKSIKLELQNSVTLNADFSIGCSVKKIYELAKNNEISTEEDLDKWLEIKSELILQIVAKNIKEMNLQSHILIIQKDELYKILEQNSFDESGLSISDFSIDIKNFENLSILTVQSDKKENL